MAGPKRQATPGDMVRSLVVLLIPLLLITFFFTRNPQPEPNLEPVNWQPVLTAARSESPFPILAPVNLPAGWVPTRVAWESTAQGAAADRWMSGWLDPDRIYLAVEQTDGPVGPFLDRVGRQPRPEGTVTVNGVEWTRQVSSDGRTRSLVQRSERFTTVVVGDTSYEALAAFAGTLSDG